MRKTNEGNREFQTEHIMGLRYRKKKGANDEWECIGSGIYKKLQDT